MALITGAMWDIENALTVHYPSPDMLFATGQAYGWAVVAPGNVWADTAGTTPGVVDATIRRLDDERGDPWIGVTTGPTLRDTAGVKWLEFANTAGRELQITSPSITNGTLMIAHKDAGVVSGNVTVPAGTYTIGRYDLFGIVGVLLIDRNLSQSEREQVRQWFITERGAGLFSTATSLNKFVRLQKMTSIDLFDTSNVTNFNEFMFGNSLTSIPLFDTSAGTAFASFLRDNTGFATVPAGLFDDVKGNDFTNAFLNCALTQQSVDNVLVSIATAAAANNLNNGTLTGLNSGTNAAPSATGIAAKNALIARGWTVTTK